MNNHVLSITSILLVSILIYYSFVKEDFQVNQYKDDDHHSEALIKIKQNPASNNRFKNNGVLKEMQQFKERTFKNGERVEGVQIDKRYKEDIPSKLKNRINSDSQKITQSVTEKRNNQLVTQNQMKLLHNYKVEELFRILANLTQMPESDIDKNEKPDFLELIHIIETIISEKSDSNDYSGNTSQKNIFDLLYPLVDSKNILSEAASKVIDNNNNNSCKQKPKDCNYGWSFAPEDTWQTHTKKPPKCVVDKSELPYVRDPIPATWNGEFKEWTDCDKGKESILPEWTPGKEDYPDNPVPPTVDRYNSNTNIGSLSSQFNRINNVDSYAEKHRLRTLSGDIGLNYGVGFDELKQAAEAASLKDPERNTVP
mgnify:CR=1 FL=1